MDFGEATSGVELLQVFHSFPTLSLPYSTTPSRFSKRERMDRDHLKYSRNYLLGLSSVGNGSTRKIPEEKNETSFDIPPGYCLLSASTLDACYVLRDVKLHLPSIFNSCGLKFNLVKQWIAVTYPKNFIRDLRLG